MGGIEIHLLHVVECERYIVYESINLYERICVFMERERMCIVYRRNSQCYTTTASGIRYLEHEDGVVARGEV